MLIVDFFENITYNGLLNLNGDYMNDQQKLVLAWDPDFTKVTQEEAQRISKAENSGFIEDSDIDWDNLSNMIS